MSYGSIVAPAAGAPLARDLVGGVNFPRSKITFGPEDSAFDVSTYVPLPVSDAAVATIGTRAYGAGQRIAVGSSDTATSGLSATEVLLHASTKCYVRAGASANYTDIPLEVGEKFSMRISSGSQIHVIRDSTDGYLNVIPVI